jgi:hypothetical protein
MGGCTYIVPVSPGIDPGYIVFPSQIIMYDVYLETAIMWTCLIISRSALGRPDDLWQVLH